MPQAWYEPAQNLSSDFVERSCAAVAGAAPQRHKTIILPKNNHFEHPAYDNKLIDSF